MMYKDATFAEKYSDKIALLVALIVSLFAAYLMFAPSKKSIQERTEKLIKDAGQIKIEALADNLPSGVRKDRYFEDAKEFEAKLDTRLGQKMASLLAPAVGPRVESHQINDSISYIKMPLFPVATQIKCSADYYDFKSQREFSAWLAKRVLTLDPRSNANLNKATELSEEYTALMRKQDPDERMRHLSVLHFTAKYQKYKMRQAYSRVKFPVLYKREVVTGWVLERQKKDPATGQWGSTEVVEHLPNQEMMFSDLGDLTPQQSDFVVNMAIQNEKENAYVELPPLSNRSRPFVNPLEVDSRVYTLEQRKRLTKNAKLLESVLKEKAKLQKSIDREEKREQARRDRELKSGRKPRSLSKRKTDKGLGGSILPDSNRPSRNARKRKTKLERLIEKMTVLEDKVSRLESDREAIDHEADASNGGDVQVEDPIGEDLTEEEKRRQAEQTIEILAHDMSMDPGHYYRYRIRIALLNPLYHREKVNPEQKAEIGDKLYLLTDPSAWSAAVYVYPIRTFFVKQASKDSSAAVEVIRMHHGKYYRENFRVYPGETIGEPKAVKMYVANPSRGTVTPNKKIIVDFNVGAVAIDTALTEQGLGLVYTSDAMGGVIRVKSRPSTSDPEYYVLYNRLTEEKKGRSRGGYRSSGRPRRALSGSGGGYIAPPSFD